MFGVFYTNDELYQQFGWFCFNDNLPVALVTDLEINYCTNKIYAGTFGHGIWESDLASNLYKIANAPYIIKGIQIWKSNKDINTDY
jgi:hypothetical protein